MTNVHPAIQRLLETNPIREPVLRSVIETLALPLRSCGLDVGCGIGLQALWLAEAVGSDGHITALDNTPELLAYADKLTQAAGFAGRITFREGDMRRLPFAAGTFDWAWSADCIGYPAGDLLPLLQELARVVRPGGTVALLGWSSQQVLPGHPLLEARLNATRSSYLPLLRGQKPEHHFMRASARLQEAGLQAVQAQTFVGSVQAPLSPAERTALMSLFEMLWVEPGPEGTADDWQEYRRLCRPESPDFILDAPGYSAFFTYSLFRGQLPPA